MRACVKTVRLRTTDHGERQVTVAARPKRKALICLVVLGAWVALAASVSAQAYPEEVFGELFTRVQLQGVFPDSKYFVDAVPKQSPEVVLAAYRAAQGRDGFDLRGFVEQHFDFPETQGCDYQTPPGVEVREHIDRLWNVLSRAPDERRAYSSLLPLPHPYVVPGGRFKEIYYWDSYFTLLGLMQSGRYDLVLDMVRDFASLIERYGFIPNGNRSYYLSRSQPPFFAWMVELAVEHYGPRLWTEFLPQLRREHAFWMKGEEALPRGTARQHVVRLPDGSLLNRYWDERDTPRAEAYRQDVETARTSRREPQAVYRDLRAAAESGWDFSSRWLEDGQTLGSIRTTALLPADLNSLLYKLELTIATGCAVTLDVVCVRQMRRRAQERHDAINRYLWSESVAAYTDYDWERQRKGSQVTAATFFPLFVGQSEPAQATAVAKTAEALLLQPYGLATTTRQTGQQWDAPNGWAPLQWIAIQGLRRYGQPMLARQIAERWISGNLRVYRQSGKLVEKYDLRGARGGSGGEYPLQDGFGWTNGVLRRLLALYPTDQPARAPLRLSSGVSHPGGQTAACDGGTVPAAVASGEASQARAP